MSTSDPVSRDSPQYPDFEPYDDFGPDEQPASTSSSGTSGAEVTDTQTPAVTRSERRRGGLVREIVETALIAILIFVAVRSLVLNFRVDGNSMLPNLDNGEMLLVNRNAYESFDLYTLVDWLPGVEHAEARDVSPFDGPHRGDIIVFDPPVQSSKPYIKRVIGLPGETVQIRDGSVYIDGEKLDEPYVENGITDCGQQECEVVTLEVGELYVMGDNRRNSSDSRSFGPVSIDSVEGKAWAVYWPASELGIVDDAVYPDE